MLQLNLIILNSVFSLYLYKILEYNHKESDLHLSGYD